MKRIKFMCVTADLSQLQAHYGDGETILANCCPHKIAFADTVDDGDFPRSSIGDIIDSTAAQWFRVDGVDFEMWRCTFDSENDEVTLDVWFQADEGQWCFDVSTEIYGEIVNGFAMTMDGAKAKALEASAVEYPGEF